MSEKLSPTEIRELQDLGRHEEVYRYKLDQERAAREKAEGEVERLGQLRPEVLKFACIMEAQLRKHDDRPGWKHESTDYLWKRLLDEVEELDQARQGEGFAGLGLGREAADVANFCMMLADVGGHLEEPLFRANTSRIDDKQALAGQPEAPEQQLPTTSLQSENATDNLPPVDYLYTPSKPSEIEQPEEKESSIGGTLESDGQLHGDGSM